MKDIIVIAGAPGAGKTTICKILREKLGSPYIDLGWLREFHLDKEWKNATSGEELMAFENLLFILRNYKKHGYENVIITDLTDEKVQRISKELNGLNFIIASLYVTDDNELQKRVLGERDSGYKNVAAAVEWNRELINRETVKNEHKIDNTHNNPQKTVDQIEQLI